MKKRVDRKNIIKNVSCFKLKVQNVFLHKRKGQGELTFVSRSGCSTMIN